MLKANELFNVPYPKANLPEKVGTYCIARQFTDSSLVLHFYNVRKEHYTEKLMMKNYFQLFCEKDSCITIMGNTPVESTIKELSYRSTFTCIEGEEIAKRFFEQFMKVHKTLVQTVKQYQEERIPKDDLTLFSDKISKTYLKRAQKKVFSDKSFLFYNSQENTGYCCVCEKDVSLNLPLGHLKESRCPSCGKKVILRDQKRGRKNLSFVGWSVKIEASHNCLLIRHFRHTWNLQDFQEKMKTREVIRTILRENLTVQSYSNDGEGWEDYREIKGFMGRDVSEYVRPQSVVYPQHFGEINAAIKKTSLMYSGAAEFITSFKTTTPYLLEAYIKYWEKYPQLEKLNKVGLSSIVLDNVMNNYYHRTSIIDLKEQELHKILKIRKEQLKWLLKCKGISYHDILILQRYKLKEKEFFTFRTIHNYKYDLDAIMELTEYTTLHKIRKYLDSQKNIGDVITARFYRDYLILAKQLGRDTKNSFILFPKNLQQRHDEAVKELKDRKDEEKRKKIEEYDKLLQENPKQSTEYFSLGKFILRLPKNCEEIKKEGEALHHCVGSYIDRVISGETQIFFLRQKENLETPFYTLEWKDHEVKQCHGYGNKVMTPEINGFVEAFKNYMLISE